MTELNITVNGHFIGEVQYIFVPNLEVYDKGPSVRVIAATVTDGFGGLQEGHGGSLDDALRDFAGKLRP